MRRATLPMPPSSPARATSPGVSAATVLAAARAAIGDLDARVLLRHALDASEIQVLAHPERVLSAAEHACFETLVARRQAGEPVAYLTGVREFYGRAFAVTPAVLIPRPETELLVDFALEHIPADRACSVLDLGTGSGCMALSIACERPLTQITGVDISAQALAVARVNARSLAVHPECISFFESDLFAALVGRTYDLIVSNPPYVAAGDACLGEGDLRFEPAQALGSGADGLAAIRVIVADARRHLAPGGWLALEHGWDQGERCRALLAAAGFRDVFTRRDLAGHERISGGQA